MKLALCLLPVFVLTLWAYAPVRHAGLVYEDWPDEPARVDDRYVTPYDPTVWYGWWTETARLRHPEDLSNFTRALPALLTRLEEARHWPAHVESVAIHLINGGLLAVLLAPLGIIPALAGTALWLWAPIQSESVAYLSARSDLLMTTGLLIALVGAQRGGWTGLGLVVAGSLTAVAAKEIGLVALAVVPVWRWWLEKVGRRREWSQWPLRLCGVLAIVGGLLFSVRLFRHFSTWVAPTAYNAFDYAAMQSAAVWRLTALALVPIGLTVDHDWEAVGAITAGLSIAALVWTIFAAWHVRKMWPTAACVVALILIPLLPRFVIPLPDFAMEHHYTASMIGICLGASRLFERIWTA